LLFLQQYRHLHAGSPGKLPQHRQAQVVGRPLSYSATPRTKKPATRTGWRSRQWHSFFCLCLGNKQRPPKTIANWLRRGAFISRKSRYLATLRANEFIGCPHGKGFAVIYKERVGLAARGALQVSNGWHSRMRKTGAPTANEHCRPAGGKWESEIVPLPDNKESPTYRHQFNA
jgi:hypothetical protein